MLTQLKSSIFLTMLKDHSFTKKEKDMEQVKLYR